jgi:hypothetical protein
VLPALLWLVVFCCRRYRSPIVLFLFNNARFQVCAVIFLSLCDQHLEMASAGPSGSSINELASRLYDECLKRYDADHLFYQQDLLGLGVIERNNLPLLLQCTQLLVDQKLFRLLQGKDNRLAWKIISREDAEKYVI